MAAAYPEGPVACVTLCPYFDGVTETGDAEHAAATVVSVWSALAEE